jgi:hypothetical protein
MTLLALVVLDSPPNPQEIIQRSVEGNQVSWKEAETYSFTEREVKSKDDSVETVRTYDVLMIQGSPYNKLIAENDIPLSSERQVVEARKFEQELYKRQHETREERDQRIAKYSKGRDQDHDLLREMAGALDYTVVGDENLDGHDVWVLDAASTPGYKPKNREAKILTGMVGKLWIDKETYQWLKVAAQVIKPVSFLGFIAKVGPGTSFVLEQEAVSGNLLPKHFSMKVKADNSRNHPSELWGGRAYSNYRITAFP